MADNVPDSSSGIAPPAAQQRRAHSYSRFTTAIAVLALVIAAYSLWRLDATRDRLEQALDLGFQRSERVARRTGVADPEHGATHVHAGGQEVGGESAAGLAETEHRDHPHARFRAVGRAAAWIHAGQYAYL